MIDLVGSIIIYCLMLIFVSFTVGLYVGAFIQRGRDVKERKALKVAIRVYASVVVKLQGEIEKLTTALNVCYSTIAALENANEELKMSEDKD